MRLLSPRCQAGALSALLACAIACSDSRNPRRFEVFADSGIALQLVPSSGEKPPGEIKLLGLGKNGTTCKIDNFTLNADGNLMVFESMECIDELAIFSSHYLPALVQGLTTFDKDSGDVVKVHLKDSKDYPISINIRYSTPEHLRFAQDDSVNASYLFSVNHSGISFNFSYLKQLAAVHDENPKQSRTGVRRKESETTTFQDGKFPVVYGGGVAPPITIVIAACPEKFRSQIPII